MIRPVSEIEFPPSSAILARASMLKRMEALKSSSDALMCIISERIGAENCENTVEVERLSNEQDRLIANMRALLAG